MVRHRKDVSRVIEATPAIDDGSRNVTLTKIAGRLHDSSRDLPRLIEDLHAVNKSRCSPPLSRTEVEKIAKSIYRRPASRPSKPPPPEEVLGFVGRHRENVLYARKWKGRGGGSDHNVYSALLDVTEKHGSAQRATSASQSALGNWRLWQV